MRTTFFRQVLFSLGWLMVWMRCAWSQQDMDLPGAIDCALRQNRDLKLLALSLDSQKLAVSDARSAFQFIFRPSGDAQAAGSRRSASVGLAASRKAEWGASAEIGGSASRQDYDDHADVRRNVVYVALEQPLLRQGGVLVSREPLTAAESRLAAARREFELKKTDLIVQVVEAHEDLARLERQLEQDRQAVQRIERFVRLTQARERQGRATRVDTLREEMKRGIAQVRLEGTEERLQSLGTEYAELLGLPPEAELRAVEAPRIALESPELEAAVAAALSNRLDYAQILQDHQDAVRGVRIARRNLWPDLKLISRYERIGEGATDAEANRRDESVWFVGLGAASDLPLTREKNAVALSLINRQAAELRIESVESAIARQVQQALLAYGRAEREIPLDERSYEAARSRLRLARRLFDMGKGDSFSVSNAEDEFQDAEGRVLAAQAAASVAAYRLLRATGSLVEYPEELKAGVLK